MNIPATLTHKDVTRPAANETPAQRMTRLAAKAIIEGCRLIAVDTDRTWTSRIGVSSGSAANLYYIVDLDARTCTCRAEGICKHTSFALASLGILPEEVAA